MKKLMTGYVYFTGSKKRMERTIYISSDGEYCIKWYGEYIQVENTNGEVTDGWRTVEQY